MNLYSATREVFRRFMTRHQVSQVIHGRTYVFVFVPVDYRQNGYAGGRQATPTLVERTQNLPESSRNGRPPVLATPPWTHFSDGRGASGDQQLNWDLMWTRFLPNPLWFPKNR